jgi:hypothetical protein
MANQFTKAEEEGREKPPGANQFTTGKREGHSQATKDRMRAEKAAELLEKEVDGEMELNDGRRAAAKILMEYGKPKLSAIEQTIHEEPATETEIMAQLHSLLANPGTRAQIQAMLAGSPTAVTEDVQSQQTLSGDNKQAA